MFNNTTLTLFTFILSMLHKMIHYMIGYVHVIFFFHFLPTFSYFKLTCFHMSPDIWHIFKEQSLNITISIRSTYSHISRRQDRMFVILKVFTIRKCFVFSNLHYLFKFIANFRHLLHIRTRLWPFSPILRISYIFFFEPNCRRSDLFKSLS